MSVRAMAAIWDHSTATGAKHFVVLLALADHADHDGNCWPSINALARKSRVSRRTVQRALDDAEAAGEIVRAVGGHGPKDTNHYRITLVDNLSIKGVTVTPLKPRKGCQNDPVKGVKTGRKGVTGDTRTVIRTVRNRADDPSAAANARYERELTDPSEVPEEVARLRRRLPKRPEGGPK